MQGKYIFQQDAPAWHFLYLLNSSAANCPLADALLKEKLS